MRIVTTNRLALALAATLIVAALAFLRQAEGIEAQRESTIGVQRDAQALAGQLLDGSKFLTDSVRAFTATGADEYERAYDEEVQLTRRRDVAMEGLARLGLRGEELALLDRAKLNSDVLIDIERRAFAARQHGEQAVALSLVFGEDYRAALRSIHGPIADFGRQVGARLDAEAVELLAHSAKARRFAQASVLSAFAVVLLALLYNHRTLVRGVARLVGGALGDARAPDPKLSRRGDELGDLSRALDVQHAELAARERGQAAHRARAELASRVATARDEAELLGMLFTYLHQAIGMLHGLYHRAHGPQRPLRTLAAFGAERDANGTAIEWGAGLVGECARSGRPLALQMPAAAGRRLVSGTGGTLPAGLLLRPVARGAELLGVLELAMLEPPGAEAEARVADVESLLATNILLQRERERAAQFAQVEHEVEARAAAELAHHVALLQSLLDGIPNPVFYKGSDSRFLGCNTAYERAFGICRTDFVGKRVLDLEYLPEADRIAFQQEDERVIAETGFVRRIVQLAWAGAEPSDNLYWVQGFRNPDGSPGGLIGTFIDITGLRASAAGDPS